MKASSQTIPVDLILCIVWSAILALLILLNVQGPIRIILGVPFIIFIPGYIFLFALFPFKRSEKGISVIERLGLSVWVCP